MAVSHVKSSPVPVARPVTTNNSAEERDAANNRQKVRAKEEAVNRAENQMAELANRVNIMV